MNHKYLEGQFGVFIVERKKHLLKIESVDGEMVTGVDHRQYPAAKTPRIDVPLDCLRAALGESPEDGGVVFGIPIKVYRRSLEHPAFSDVHVWRPIKKAEWHIIRDSATRVLKKLGKNGIGLPHPIELNIVPAKGKYAGTYTPVYKLDEFENPKPDVIHLMPPEIEESSMDYLLAHEFGHGVWARILTRRSRAKWVTAYLKYVALSQVGLDEINAIKFEVEKQKPSSLKDLHALFADDEEQARAASACVTAILTNHSLKPRYLDVLLSAEKSIGSLFPRHPIDVGDLGEMVTEYAKVSPEEFFCEALACWTTGMVLPQDLLALLESTTS